VPLQTDNAADAGADAKAAICEALRTAYRAAVQVAEECTIGAARQCAQRVFNAAPVCQCPFVINDNLSGAVYSLGYQFQDAQCSAGCLGPCSPSYNLSCQADPTSPTGGRCLAPTPDAGP
jgi:hypothetical protein